MAKAGKNDRTHDGDGERGSERAKEVHHAGRGADLKARHRVLDAHGRDRKHRADADAEHAQRGDHQPQRRGRLPREPHERERRAGKPDHRHPLVAVEVHHDAARQDRAGRRHHRNRNEREA